MTLFLVFLIFLTTGCEVLPKQRFRPTLHNPRMQLREVGIVPFLNRSGNSHLDGYETAQLYANQLQRISGFNVTPVETVKQAMIDNNLTSFNSVDDIRKLGKYLNVDVIVIGSVNQYSSYQPPVLGLEVEWFAVNPYFHPIVKGHGLPWGTPAEKEIPDKVVLQVEEDLARAQLATQTPDPDKRNVQTKPKRVPLRQFNPDSNTSTPVLPLSPSPNGYPSNTMSLGDSVNANNLSQIDQQFEQTRLNNAARFAPSLPNTNNSYPNTFLPQEISAPKVVTAYYPQFDESADEENYDNDERDFSGNVDKATELYLARQQLALGELMHRAQGIFSQPILIPQPDASSQYSPYEKPLKNPSHRIPGTMNAPYRSQEMQNSKSKTQNKESQNLSPQSVPVIQGQIPAVPNYLATTPGTPIGPGWIAGEPENFHGLPADWPDPRGLIPDVPQAELPQDLTISNEPVMRHVAIYNGNDVDFTRRLADYEAFFIDERRIGGWQGILRRPTDFISACCCMHIWEMLSSRGGAGKAEKITRYDKFWMNP
ncbi:MAG: hypothetical protein LBT05_15610 [Planctomycetaceae bacterium]|nr:hypothetical protein [Planctomycetaceae bacterium]